MREPLRQLMRPRWLLVHLAFLLAVAATGWLASWQWERAQEAGGSFQNLGYALQWPLFGIFTLFLWYRVVRMAQGHSPPAEQVIPESPMGGGAGEAPISDSREDESAGQLHKDGDGSSRKAERRSGKRRLVPRPAPSVSAEDDPALAEYNEYLAHLHARKQQD